MLGRMNDALKIVEQRFPVMVCDPDGFYINRETPGSYELELYVPMWTTERYLFLRLETGLWFPFQRVGPPYGYGRIGMRAWVAQLLLEAWEASCDHNGLDRWGEAYQGGVSSKSVRYISMFMERKREWREGHINPVDRPKPRNVAEVARDHDGGGQVPVQERPILALHRGVRA